MKRFILLVSLLFITSCEPKEDIYYVGSNSVLLPIQILKKAYEQQKPDIKFKEHGEGSNSFHINKNSIFGQSREMKAVEKEWGEKFGPLKHKKICFSALAIIINPDNPVNELTMEQLKQIFTGKIKNWQEVGGNHTPITVLGRGGRSGSEDYFEEKVLDGKKITGRRHRLASNEQVIEAVTKQKNAVGYIGAGDLDKKKVKVLALRHDKESQGVLPEYKNLKNETYPIIRPLYILFLDDANQEVKDFMDFALSQEGQKVIKEAGFLPIKNIEE